MPEREPLRRGQIIGERVGGEPADEAEHFLKRCPTSGGVIDMRDLPLEAYGVLVATTSSRRPSRAATWSWPVRSSATSTRSFTGRSGATLVRFHVKQGQRRRRRWSG
jgi:hypothetical protein